MHWKVIEKEKLEKLKCSRVRVDTVLPRYVITGYCQSVRMIFILVLGEKALGKDKLTWKSSDFQKSVLVLMQKQIKQFISNKWKTRNGELQLP